MIAYRPFVISGFIVGALALTQATLPARAESNSDSNRGSRSERGSSPTSSRPTGSRSSTSESPGRLLGGSRPTSSFHPIDRSGGPIYTHRDSGGGGFGSSPFGDRMRSSAPPMAPPRYEGRGSGQGSTIIGDRSTGQGSTYSGGRGNGPVSILERDRESGRSGRSYGSSRNADSGFSRSADSPYSNRGGVTDVGRALGYGRPVDQAGRTDAGRALNLPTRVDSRGRTDVGRALGGLSGPSRVDGRFQSRGPIRFGYDPRSGHFAPWSESRSSFSIGVLFGTAAPRPIYRFHRPGFAVSAFYYPFYFTSVVGAGYDCYPSPYFFFDYGPLYIPSTRVVVVDRPVYIEEGSDQDLDSYYLNRHADPDLDSVMQDIRRSWMSGDIDLLLKHVRADQDVQVSLRGKYLYSIPSEDYRDLTQDAMTNSTTEQFRWVSTDRPSSDEAHLTADQTFTDANGKRHTVVASFDLVRVDEAWWIAGVGSSKSADD